MKRRLIAGFFTLGFALAMADATASAGSVLVSNPSWQFVGPQSINGVLVRFGTAGVLPLVSATGRVTSIAVDPTAAATCGPLGNSACRIFVGTAGGGVWMTTDGGITFTQITHLLDPSSLGQSFPQTTVGALALNPSTSPPTIYLGTGEGNGGDSFWGEGLFSSANLGSSWAQIAGSVTITSGASLPASYEGEGFTKLAIDTNQSPPYVFAAALPEYGTDRAGLSPFIAQTYSGFWDCGVQRTAGPHLLNTRQPCWADAHFWEMPTNHVRPTMLYSILQRIRCSLQWMAMASSSRPTQGIPGRPLPFRVSRTGTVWAE
jgi:hypothetical protein